MTYITLQDVKFDYPNGVIGIKDVFLSIDQKEFTAIVGPNGGGKTTLGKLMAGIFKPTSGKIFIDGTDSQRMTLGTIGQKIGYLFQNPERQIFAPTVEEELTFPLAIKGVPEELRRRKAEELMELFELTHLRKSFPFILSQGEKQRLALAGILMNNPPFLILDEPTTGLDKERRGQLSQLLCVLQEKGIGMAVISHDESFVKYHSTRVIEVNGGKVTDDDR